MSTATRSDADGRVLRRQENHRAMVEAVYVLVRRLGRLPEVPEVAAEAGVSPRTVFRQFEDLDQLWESINERVLTDLIELAGSEPPSGVLLTDLLNTIACRVRLVEHMRPFRKAIALQQARRGSSTWLAGIENLINLTFRDAVQRRLGPFTRDAITLEALDMVLSSEAWERLRSAQGLSVEQASDVLRLQCLRLLDQR